MSMLRMMRRDPSRTCPYYRRGRKCAFGCWSEPYCVTGQPLAGWPWERLMGKGRHIRKVKQRPMCVKCAGPLVQRDGVLVCGRCER